MQLDFKQLKDLREKTDRKPSLARFSNLTIIIYREKRDHSCLKQLSRIPHIGSTYRLEDCDLSMGGGIQNREGCPVIPGEFRDVL